MRPKSDATIPLSQTSQDARDAALLSFAIRHGRVAMRGSGVLAGAALTRSTIVDDAGRRLGRAKISSRAITLCADDDTVLVALDWLGRCGNTAVLVHPVYGERWSQQQLKAPVSAADTALAVGLSSPPVVSVGAAAAVTPLLPAQYSTISLPTPSLPVPPVPLAPVDGGGTSLRVLAAVVLVVVMGGAVVAGVAWRHYRATIAEAEVARATHVAALAAMQRTQETAEAAIAAERAELAELAAQKTARLTMAPPTEVEMRAPIDALYAAWRNLDLDGYRAVWAPDAVKIDLSNGKRYSVPELVTSRRALFAKIADVGARHDTRLRSYADGIATFDTRYAMTLTFKNGKVFREQVKESYRIRKFGEHWLIVENRDYEPE
jgi:hypothetical protein